MIELRFDANNVSAMIRHLLQQVPGGLEGAVMDSAELVRSDLRTRLSFPRANYLQRAPRGYLGQRSGELADSIQIQLRHTADGPIANVGPSGTKNRMLAIVHEQGRTIIPRHAMYLKVPLPTALDGFGLPLPQESLPHPQFVFRSKRGNLLIGYGVGSGKNRSVVPLFALKSMVVLPARRMFSEEVAAVGPQISQLVNRRIQHLLQ